MKYLRIETLDKGWHDKDEVLLHAAFQLLVDFVEHEKPDSIIDWNADEEYRRAWREIRTLYHWWTETRPKRRSPLDDPQLAKPPLNRKRIPGTRFSVLVEPDQKKYARYYRAVRQHARLEQRWHEEDQRNLHRLINIRGYLWT